MICEILTKLHQNSFGGRALPGPTGELTALPRLPSWILRVDTGKGGEGKGGGKGREEGTGGEERKGGERERKGERRDRPQ